MSEREKFEKWWRENGIEFASIFENSAAWKGWQAALSTRKPYGYGIVDKDGNAIDEMPGDSKKHMYAIVSKWNGDCDKIPGCPYRVVELFYEEQS